MIVFMLDQLYISLLSLLCVVWNVQGDLQSAEAWSILLHMTDAFDPNNQEHKKFKVTSKQHENTPHHCCVSPGQPYMKPLFIQAEIDLWGGVVAVRFTWEWVVGGDVGGG
ncbi:MAG: hypothetical protein Q8807_03810, partial ['Waltheria sp.' little leaf phytoplasma]|nr:hypothetical protein ['Waltheria sp.' little leaf phytoplasma]